MKKSYLILAVVALSLVSIFAFAESKKVLQIFKNGEVIKEYPLDYIDYIEVHDIDSEGGENRPGADIPDNPLIAMRDSLDYIYLNLATFGPDGTSNIPMVDGGMGSFQRGIFNLEEVPTDEACWMPAADNLPHYLTFGFVKPSDSFILASYLRMMLVCNFCNSFINKDFNLEYIEEPTARYNALLLREEYVRQVKIIRSAMYFYLINEFGNVPYFDETLAPGDTPSQLSTDFATGRRLVTQKVVQTLKELVDWYKANNPANNPEYGQVGLDVAEALLVKFYLNYEVFTGIPAWNKCFEHAQALIERRGRGGFNNTGLAMNYSQCFSYNNRVVATNELIWPISTLDRNGNKILNWSNGEFMLSAFAGYNIYRTYNSSSQWQCMVARRQLVDAFDWEDDDMSISKDKRVKWWATSAQGYSADNPNLAFQYYGQNGYAPIKFTNWNILDDGSVDYSNIPPREDPMAIDYGMIRLAEIYLSAAEAALNGGGSTEQALEYVNNVRQRAGLEPFNSLNMNDLRKERQRELYTECTRRTDLIRYGLWISGYNWNWKAQEANGADFPANFTVYPLPASIVDEYGYVQNPEIDFPDIMEPGAVYPDIPVDRYIYLVGSPQDGAEPTKSNYNKFVDFRLEKSEWIGKVYKGNFSLPENPQFRFYTSLDGWGSECFGSNVNDVVTDCEFIDDKYESPLVKGKGMFSLKNFKGGYVNITVDLRDENNMSVTIINEGECIYLVGNVTDWREPSYSNYTYYKDWRLFKKEGESAYSGIFYLDAAPMFRFYRTLDGWDETSMGYTEQDNITSFPEFTGQSAFSSSLYYWGKGAWNFPNFPGGYVKIVVDLDRLTFDMYPQ